MYLNTQAMTSTFNESLRTMKTYPMDVVLLTETWLRDQKELLNYVSIDGYATEFRHRVATKGGGVGAYIKENVAYKRRFDIETLNPTWSTCGWSFEGETNTVNCCLELFTGQIY